MIHRLRLIFRTRRGCALLLLHTLAAFGVISGLVQFYSAVWVPQESLPYAKWIFLAALAVSLGYGIGRAWPRREISRDFRQPTMTITVKEGDLFGEREAHLVVGFSDTFDTDTCDDRIISSASVQGQLLARQYNGNVGALDAELARALARTPATVVEPPGSKAEGKQERYPIGTVAVLAPSDCLIFGVAYSRMGNDLKAVATVDGLWHALSSLWDAVHARGQKRRVAVPVLGGELARITSLSHETLLKMLLLSFVSKAREMTLSSELVVVIHPSNYLKVNMLEVDAFLDSL